MNRVENAYKNYYVILDGEYDLEKVQEIEHPFYEHLQRWCGPIEAMERPMTYEEMNKYWIQLPEHTSSSPWGRHAGLYKAMHAFIPTEEAGILQKNSDNVPTNQQHLYLVRICTYQMEVRHEYHATKEYWSTWYQQNAVN